MKRLASKRTAEFIAIAVMAGAAWAQLPAKDSSKTNPANASTPAQSTSTLTSTMTGYSPAAAARERETERAFRAVPTPQAEEAWHKALTAEPHTAGTAANKRQAEYIAAQWKQLGLEDVRIREYDVLNSLPRSVALEMISPIIYQATLREQEYPVDPDTMNTAAQQGFLSMSASGEVTAPIVYAYSGNPEDYEVLKKAGIDVRGKIVLVRYSNPYSYRGFKALTAERMGAAGILIYSDPQEDGYKQGKVFPEGPWGPETHIQRGSITYDFIVPGDPLTPGWASVPGAKRIGKNEAQSLPHIMALPLSWHDAKPLLEHMGGPPAPKEWQGGLPIAYKLGGEATVHMKVDMDTSVMPNYVVEGRIHGSESPDEWVLLGNHHDAWVYGGVDPSSGTASMMEVARGMGALLKKGLRPRRTIVFGSWDGEEVGLTGSTEWGEDNAEQLKKNLVAYINVDSSTSGPDFEPSAVPSLGPLLIELSGGFTDPRTHKPLLDAWTAYASKQGGASSKPSAKSTGATGSAEVELVNPRIGSGSDHTVFLNHLGRPAALLEFNGPYGVYHSIYDDHYWMEHFGDPGFAYHTLMSQYWGTLALRLANAEVLPFDFENYAARLRAFLKEVEEKPGAKEKLEWKQMADAVDAFETAGRQTKAAALKATPAQRARLNAAYMQIEGNWLDDDGLPGRPWFKHMLYASRFTYAHLELPGITEAVEAQNWSQAGDQMERLRRAVEKNAKVLREASE